MLTYMKILSVCLIYLIPGIIRAQEFATDVANIAKENFQAKHSQISSSEDGLWWRINLEENSKAGETAELIFNTESWNSELDWREYDELTLLLTNKSTETLSLALKLQGRRAHLAAKYKFAPSEKNSINIPLDELALTASPELPRKLVFELSQKGEFLWQKLTLRKRSKPAPPLRDQFGQRRATQWEGKVESEDELIQMAKAELVALGEMKNPPQRNKFGGWTGLESQKATGFFRLEKGKKNEHGIQSWTLIDPEGYPFWSLGVTGLRHKYPMTDVTLWKGREEYFEALPPQGGPYAQAYEDEDYVSFYTWNILRKWGSLEKWREVSFQRLGKWGINTLGNWAHESVLAETPIPYTRALQSNRGNAPRLGESRLPDVFDPAWITHLDSVFSTISSLRTDSLLIGYFVDNEMGWQHLDLLDKAHTASKVRERWLSLVKKEFNELEDVNKAWQTDFSTWQELRNLEKGPESNSAFETSYQKLETAFADQYFRIIDSVLKIHDPNHLYMGCRFTRRIKPDHVVAAAGRYCDILSVNVYSYEPIREDMDEWHKLSGGLPILIGEHHVSLKSPRQLSPNYQDFTQEERYEYFTNYVKVWASTPYSLGSHWYQYKDQPLTGRGTNGEQRIIGLVDITDQPHKELIRALKYISANVYEWKKLP